MLELRKVETAYASSQVLFGVDLEIAEGEIVSLIGRNGMGKTTTVRSIMGLTPPRRGDIRLLGRSIVGEPPFRIARAGVGLVPEGRQIFPTLTLRENLTATARGKGWGLADVYDLFPHLAQRERSLGNQLSGGEQQMLAIARALLTNPRVLILDEATEGLAPAIRGVIWDSIRRLRERGQSLLIIDARLEALLEVCDRHYLIDKGRIVWSGSSEALREQPELLKRYLGV